MQPQTFSAVSNKTGTEYFLHCRPSSNGKTSLYFFAKTVKEGAIPKLPEGYEVSENPSTGLPILRKTVKAA